MKKYIALVSSVLFLGIFGFAIAKSDYPQNFPSNNIDREELPTTTSTIKIVPITIMEQKVPEQKIEQPAISFFQRIRQYITSLFNKKKTIVNSKPIIKNNSVTKNSNVFYKFWERSEEQLDGQTMRVSTSFALTNRISFSKNIISFKLVDFGGCNQDTYHVPIDVAYIIKDGQEVKLTSEEIKNWPKNSWISLKVYYPKEKTSNNSFYSIINKLIPVANASCKSFYTIDDAKKIIFQFPEIQEQKTIEVLKKGWYDDMIALEPKPDQGLYLFSTENYASGNDFFTAKRMENAKKEYIKLKDNSLLEMNIGNTPADSIIDYTVDGNFVCSSFNNYCFFKISKSTTNTKLELIDGNIKSIPFEKLFLAKDNIFRDIKEKDGRYLWGDFYDRIDLTDFVKQTIKSTGQDVNFIEDSFHDLNIYAKGRIDCKVIKDNNDVNTLECTHISDIAEIRN